LCEDHAQLANALAAPPVAFDLAEFGAGVSALLDAEDQSALGWLRSRPTWLRRSLLIALGLGVPGTVVLFNRRPDLLSYWQPRPVGVLLVLSSSALTLGWVALTPLDRASQSAPSKLALAIAALLPAIVGLPPLNVLAYAGPDPVGSIWSGVLPCFIYGAVIALGLMLAWRAMDRSSIPNRAVWACAAVMATTWANVGLSLHCPVGRVSHLLLAHASLPGVLLLLVGLGFAVRLGLVGRLGRQRKVNGPNSTLSS
jgi:hypothetical protein